MKLLIADDSTSLRQHLSMLITEFLGITDIEQTEDVPGTIEAIKAKKPDVAFAETVAGGDLTADIDVEQKDEIGQLADALKNMIGRLRDIVAEVNSAAQNVAAGSEELSSSAQEMSQGATEQAASGEEVSSSMEEMGSNIKQNADNALQTEKISAASSEQNSGGDVFVWRIYPRRVCPVMRAWCVLQRH